MRCRTIGLLVTLALSLVAAPIAPGGSAAEHARLKRVLFPHNTANVYGVTAARAYRDAAGRPGGDLRGGEPQD